jgi:hypothetical protein
MATFYPESARFLNSKGTNSVGTLCTNRKCPTTLHKDERLKKGKHCGQHSEISEYISGRIKRITMISMYHKD